MTALAQTSTAAAPAATAPAAASPAPSTPTTTAVGQPTTKIGIINIQQAIMLTTEGKRDFEALDKKFEPKRAELQKLNAEVQDLQKQLSAQGDKLNEEARANMTKQIEGKQKSLQRSYEDAQGDFQTQQNDIVNRIGGRLMEVLDKYAKANNYTLILDVSSPQSPVLWAGQAVDITKDVADAFNAQAPAAASAPSAPGAGSPRPATSRPAATGTSRPAGTTTPKPTTPK